MATKLTKKQQGELTEKLAGIIQKNNALQLRLSMDTSVNEMNVNQISGALNRIHGQAIGKELSTVITIPPSLTGYEITGIGTVYAGELNIETGVFTATYSSVDLGTLDWRYTASTELFWCTLTDVITGITRTEPIPFICSKYATAESVGSQYVGENQIGTGTSGGVSNSTIIINDPTYTDPAAFKASLSGVQLVYELATPETYTLTPEQMIQLLDQL